MFRNILFKTLRDYRYVLFWWSLGFVALSFYLMYFYPYVSRAGEFLQLMEKLPPIIKNLIGDTAKLTTPEGFFSVQPFSMTAPILFLIFAISRAGDTLAGEKERGTLDLLLANPISRARVLIEKFVAICAGILLLAAVFGLAMSVSSWVFAVTLNKFRLMEMVFSCFLLGAVFTALTLMMGALFMKKKIGYGLIGAFAMITYLVDAYAPMVKSLRPFRYFSPFYYYNGATPLVNGLNPIHVAVLVLLTAGLFYLALRIFHTRDLVA